MFDADEVLGVEVPSRRGTHLATLLPLDKERNADRRRRAIADATAASALEPPRAPAGTAPLRCRHGGRGFASR